MSKITQEQQVVINEALKEVVLALGLDPKMAGIALQLAYYRPKGADGYVTGLFIGDSGHDTTSAIDQLVHEPAYPPYNFQIGLSPQGLARSGSSKITKMSVEDAMNKGITLPYVYRS
jgi:hypothetical protein